jgi:hypothetical protein
VWVRVDRVLLNGCDSAKNLPATPSEKYGLAEMSSRRSHGKVSGSVWKSPQAGSKRISRKGAETQRLGFLNSSLLHATAEALLEESSQVWHEEGGYSYPSPILKGWTRVSTLPAGR